MHQFDLKNRTAIITGGAQGFGLDIAKRFLDSGAKAIIWDIDEEELKKVNKQMNNPNLSYNVVDVSNFKNVSETVDEIAKFSNIGRFFSSHIMMLGSALPIKKSSSFAV